MDRGAWRASLWGCTESDTTELLSTHTLAVQWLTSSSSAGGVGWILSQTAKIPHDLRPMKQIIKQKQYCNKFNKDFKNGPHQKKNLKKYMRKVGGFLLFVFFALILLLIDYSIIILYFCEMLGLIQVHVLITHTWKLLVCIFAASLEISFTFTFTWLMFQKFCI